MVGGSTVDPASPAGEAAGAPLRKNLTAGIHAIDAASYHADPAPKPSLSSHVAQVLLHHSPAHAWLQHPRLNPNFQPANDPKFDVGRAAHMLMCEGSAAFEIIDAKNWKSEAARDERDAVIRAGKIALLEHEWTLVSTMVKAARAQLRQTKDAANAFREGEGEATLIWQEHGGVWCRARADWLQRKAGKIFDYKTTWGSASPRVWAARPMYDIGGDLQHAMYTRGASKLLGRPVEFIFCVQECEPPFALSLVTLAPAAAESATMDLNEALDAWRTCTRRNIWPAYSRRLFHAEAPVWRQKDQEARFLQRQADRDAKVDPFKLAIQLWRPQ